MAREKTVEEVREEFLEHVRIMVDYWDDVPKDTTKEKLNGLAFSILAAIDGCSGDLPSFILAPLPHKDDKQYRIDEGDNYYPENHLIEDQIKCDIGGCLHEQFYKK